MYVSNEITLTKAKMQYKANLSVLEYSIKITLPILGGRFILFTSEKTIYGVLAFELSSD